MRRRGSWRPLGRVLPSVEAAFAPVPLRTVPFFDREMVGADRLREVGVALFGADDPTTVFYRGRPYEVLRENGNMSSATVMFVLEQILAERQADDIGCAMAFGPGLTAETMMFHTVDAA